MEMRKNSIIYWVLENEIPVIANKKGIQTCTVKTEKNEYSITMSSLSVSECSYKFKWLLLLLNYIYNNEITPKEIKLIGDRKGTRTNKSNDNASQYFVNVFNSLNTNDNLKYQKNQKRTRKK